MSDDVNKLGIYLELIEAKVEQQASETRVSIHLLMVMVISSAACILVTLKSFPDDLVLIAGAIAFFSSVALLILSKIQSCRAGKIVRQTIRWIMTEEQR